MYGLFTKLGLGAVVSAGLSVLGISYLSTDVPSNHLDRGPAAVVAIEVDAASSGPRGCVACPGALVSARRCGPPGGASQLPSWLRRSRSAASSSPARFPPCKTPLPTPRS